MHNLNKKDIQAIEISNLKKAFRRPKINNITTYNIYI